MRLANFLENSIASSFWFSFIDASGGSINKQTIVKENDENSLEHYHLELNANISAPMLIVPLMKNNDPNSPIWVFKLGNLNVISKPESKIFQKFNVDISSICFEVFYIIYL